MDGSTTMEKSAALKPIFFRLKGPDAHAFDRRLSKLCTVGRDRNDIAREGLYREVARLETEAAPLTAAELRAITDFKRVTRSKLNPDGADVAGILRAAARDSIVRERRATSGS